MLNAHRRLPAAPNVNVSSSRYVFAVKDKAKRTRRLKPGRPERKSLEGGAKQKS